MGKARAVAVRLAVAVAVVHRVVALGLSYDEQSLVSSRRPVRCE